LNHLRLNPADHVVVATRAIPAGSLLDGTGIRVIQAVDVGHKVAVVDIAEGAAIRKYNQVIGRASAPITAGDHVHEHNLAFSGVSLAHAFSSNLITPSPPGSERTFMGIVRPDTAELTHRYATRNYIGIVTTVNCSATVARAIATRMDQEARAAIPGIDGVVALTHGGGCAMDGEGEGLKVLQRTLAGMMRHPNFSHILIVGLGCETNQSDRLLREGGLEPGERIAVLGVQDTGGTTATIEAGCEIIRGWLPSAGQIAREPVPVSKLIVGLQCGGSDGLSGVTANPALGVASDLLVSHGGTVILSETPEVYGAEHLLTARAVSSKVAEKLLERIAWWERHVHVHGADLDNNPSPGNRAGGITTILEKSLGAVAKAGSSPLQAVYEYAETVSKSGFVYMDSPGYDPVSCTGQMAAGANMICFTTGRGSAFGSKPAPCLKLATNTVMWQRMQGDMDINCGDLLDGGVSLAEKGRQIFELIIASASGHQTRSEALGLGDNEFVPWSLGPVL
jgi:altronate hydrolase